METSPTAQPLGFFDVELRAPRAKCSLCRRKSLRSLRKSALVDGS